jgi:hypothetical protein
VKTTKRDGNIPFFVFQYFQRGKRKGYLVLGKRLSCAGKESSATGKFLVAGQKVAGFFVAFLFLDHATPATSFIPVSPACM